MSKFTLWAISILCHFILETFVQCH